MRRFLRMLVAVFPWTVRITWASLKKALLTWWQTAAGSRGDIERLVNEWFKKAQTTMEGEYAHALRFALHVGAWAAYITALLLVSHLVVWIAGLVF